MPVESFPLSSSSCISLLSQQPIASDALDRKRAEACMEEINDCPESPGIFRMRKDNRLEMRVMLLPVKAEEEGVEERVEAALNASFSSSAAVIAEAVRRNHGAE
ncbi:MAG: hypothetical protein ACI4WR_05280 [Bulleidia sp.]